MKKMYKKRKLIKVKAVTANETLYRCKFNYIYYSVDALFDEVVDMAWETGYNELYSVGEKLETILKNVKKCNKILP